MISLKIEILEPDTFVINRIVGTSNEFWKLLSEMKWDDEFKGKFILTKKWKKGIVLELELERES
jgi:hypothetical protein